jgi:hypothetical protein
MGMAWIQALDIAGAFLGFSALFAVLLMLGKVPTANNHSKTHSQRPR